MGRRQNMGNNSGFNSHNTNPSIIAGERFVCSRKFIPAGAEIYAEGEFSKHLHLVIEGWAYQYQYLKDGRRQILDFCLPGALLGLQGEGSTEMRHSAESLTDAVVAIIPRWWLREFYALEPKFAIRLAFSAGEALNHAYDNLTDVGRRNAYEAVAHLMLRLFKRIQAQSPGITKKCVEFPLTQTHIGDALGLTNVHVCRTLKSLQDEGVLEIRANTLTVLNTARLSEIAASRSEFVTTPGQGGNLRSYA